MPKAKSHRPIKHAVILVNYNNSRETIDCITSIKKSKDAPHVIVVDSGSSKESQEELRLAFPDLDLIISDNNGFSAGNNIGIKKALRLGAKVIYILNNDTEVNPNLFYRSYRYVVGKNRLAGGKIYYAKGFEFHKQQKGKGNILWYAGGYFDRESVIARHYGVDEEDQGQYDQIKKIDFITGCFIAVPRRVFSRIGFFYEPYFLYLEDLDFCLRAESAGIEVIYNPHLVVYHKNSSSTVAGSPLVDYYLTRNRLLLGKRHGNWRLNLALFKEAITRNWKNKIRRLAFFDYLTGRMGNQNERIYALTQKV